MTSLIWQPFESRCEGIYQHLLKTRMTFWHYAVFVRWMPHLIQLLVKCSSGHTILFLSVVCLGSVTSGWGRARDERHTTYSHQTRPSFSCLQIVQIWLFSWKICKYFVNICAKKSTFISGSVLQTEAITQSMLTCPWYQNNFGEFFCHLNNCNASMYIFQMILFVRNFI